MKIEITTSGLNVVNTWTDYTIGLIYPNGEFEASDSSYRFCLEELKYITKIASNYEAALRSLTNPPVEDTQTPEPTKEDLLKLCDELGFITTREGEISTTYRVMPFSYSQRNQLCRLLSKIVARRIEVPDPYMLRLYIGIVDNELELTNPKAKSINIDPHKLISFTQFIKLFPALEAYMN